MSHSWVSLSELCVLKEMDGNAFRNNDTRIPVDTQNFFQVTVFKIKEIQEILLLHQSKKYPAIIKKTDATRATLRWRKELASYLQVTFPNIYLHYLTSTNAPPNNPYMKLSRTQDPMSYTLEFVMEPFEEIVKPDLSAIETKLLTASPQMEGALIESIRKTYERHPVNRHLAIKIHGTVCMGCQFDFEAFYGKLGKNFIEIHHTKPLSTLDGKLTPVDPYTDLVPLCANCHRMVHRKRESVLSLDELKRLISKNGRDPIKKIIRQDIHNTLNADSLT